MKNECETGENDCDVNADCHDTDESYICTCRKGFTDKSPNLSRMPGRVCSKRESTFYKNLISIFGTSEPKIVYSS